MVLFAKEVITHQTAVTENKSPVRKALLVAANLPERENLARKTLTLLSVPFDSHFWCRVLDLTQKDKFTTTASTVNVFGIVR